MTETSKSYSECTARKYTIQIYVNYCTMHHLSQWDAVTTTLFPFPNERKTQFQIDLLSAHV